METHKTRDGLLVRHLMAITDFIIENRDYLHHQGTSGR